MLENRLSPLVPERFLNEPSYRNGHIRVINPLPGVRVMGLHIPDIKKTAKTLASSDEAFSLLDTFAEVKTGELCYEEKVVWGLMLDYLKCPLEERLSRFSAFIPVIDNWAVCDCVCGAAKWASVKSLGQDGLDTVQEWLVRYWNSDREFEVRFAVIMSMSYYMNETFLPEIFRKIDALDFGRVKSSYLPPVPASVPVASVVPFVPQEGSKESTVFYGLSGRRAGTALGRPPYYMKMGVAWFLATALAKYPDLTRQFVGNCSLPDDVIKLYKRKSRESLRTRDTI